MDKHTPGPWWLDIGKTDAAIHAGGTIAMISDIMTGWRANAHLIAAAPDLLAALEWAVETADTEQYEADWYAAARAAIRKARGD